MGAKRVKSFKTATGAIYKSLRSMEVDFKDMLLSFMVVITFTLAALETAR